MANDMQYVLQYVVVGGGFAGLYANYKLSNMNKKGVLLEKTDTLGGRGKEIFFHDVRVKCGAGIATKDNKILMKLLKKVGVETPESDNHIEDTIQPPFNMKDAVEEIKKEFKNISKTDMSKLNVNEILIKYFGKDFTNKFKKHSEFRDYMCSSMDYLMNYYDIDDLDNQDSKKVNMVWEKVIEYLTLPNCITGYTVKTIKKVGDTYVINNEIKTREVILATTISTIEKIKFEGVKLPDIREYIGSVPFSRVYVHFKDGYDYKYGYALVPNELEKIVKMNKNVLMASYSDGKNANLWCKLGKLPKADQLKAISAKLKEIGINETPDDILITYHKDGVHFTKPYGKFRTLDNLIDKLSKPVKGITIIGEMLSKKNGWVEGALLSVERALR